jgi:hypothetical protein
MPMVPEMLNDLTVSRNALFFKSNFIAQGECKFFPNLDIRKYLEQLNGAQKDELEKRSNILEKHAVENQMYRVSESSWEADIRSDVFGKIREDPRLRMYDICHEIQFLSRSPLKSLGNALII